MPEKKGAKPWTISGEGVTIEVSSGMGGRVILAGKS